MEARATRLMDANLVGLNEKPQHRRGCTLLEALEKLDGPFEKLGDGYPEWHSAPHPFTALSSYFSIGNSPARATVSTPGIRSSPTASASTAFPTNRCSRALCKIVTIGAIDGEDWTVKFDSLSIVRRNLTLVLAA